MNTHKVITLTNDWPTILMGETLIFSLLGKILYTNPREDFLRSLTEQEVFTGVPFGEKQPNTIEGLRLLGKWMDEIDNKITTENIKDIQVDYTRLFTGMLKVPVAPWESIYFNEEHLLFQEQTLDVRSWYGRFGLELEKKHKEPDDHIGLELSFVGHLAQKALLALESGDENAFNQILDAKQDFLSQHPLVWIPTWCDQIIIHANTDFYRGLAMLVWGSLKEVSEIFDLEIKELIGV